MKKQLTCYHCGKLVKGEAVHTVPANIQIMLGLDFPKAWHPGCYKKAEAEAEAELRRN